MVSVTHAAFSGRRRPNLRLRTSLEPLQYSLARVLGNVLR